VRFAGRCRATEYRALLRRARVFVTAPRREDHGIAQLEALADGCALVTTPSPGRTRRCRSRARSTRGSSTGDLAAALRAALDEPAAGYAERAAEALRPYSHAAVDRVVADVLLPRLLDSGDDAAPARPRARRRAGRLGGRRRAHLCRAARAAAAVAAEIEGARRVAVWAESTLETIVAAVAVLESGLALVPVNPKLGAPSSSTCSRRRPGRDPRRARPGAAGTPVAPPSTCSARRRPARARRGRRGPGADRLHERHHRPAQGRRARAPLRELQPRRARRRLGVDGRRRPHPRAAAVPRARARDRRLGPLRRGGELRHLGRFEPAAAAAALRDGATMLFGVPTMYHRIAQEAEDDAAIVEGLRAARILVSGSAPLPPPVFTRDRGALRASRSSSATGSPRR
jgi:hypothetical protein